MVVRHKSQTCAMKLTSGKLSRLLRFVPNDEPFKASFVSQLQLILNTV